MPEDMIANSIAEISPELKQLALDIHANPELGFEEFKAVEKQVALLKNWGFEVTVPFCGLDTAYKAVYGKGGPVFCFMAEYDALPGFGHACGHNLVCTAALGAGKALSDSLKEKSIPGTVVIMGTPGEEGKGGKVLIVQKGGMQDIDAAIMAHPESTTTLWSGCFAVERFDVVYTGKAAHAACASEHGINALDAVMLLFQGVNAWREHLPEKTRIHGIVSEGGEAPNIVPDRAVASFYLRAHKQQVLESMIQRFKRIAEGAALMTDCGCSIEAKEIGYKSGLPNASLNQAFFDAASELGMDPKIPDDINRASTDFGDVSHAVPGVHVYFGILKEAETHSLHSVEFAEAAKSDYAIQQTLKASRALAQIGLKFFTDADFRERVTADHKKMLSQ